MKKFSQRKRERNADSTAAADPFLFRNPTHTILSGAVRANGNESSAASLKSEYLDRPLFVSCVKNLLSLNPSTDVKTYARFPFSSVRTDKSPFRSPSLKGLLFCLYPPVRAGGPRKVLQAPALASSPSARALRSSCFYGAPLRALLQVCVQSAWKTLPMPTGASEARAGRRGGARLSQRREEIHSGAARVSSDRRRVERNPRRPEPRGRVGSATNLQHKKTRS